MRRLVGWPTGAEGHQAWLSSFEVMAALAEPTDRIQLYGSVALPTVHPAITARRGATIDHISQGRFGINLVPGWQKDEGDHAHLPGVPGGAAGVRRAGVTAPAHGQALSPPRPPREHRMPLMTSPREYAYEWGQ